MVKLLVLHKADINSTNNAIGTTALIEASYLGLFSIVQLFLNNNADPNINKRGNYTALMASTSIEHAFSSEHKKVFCELIRFGADPNAKFYTGSTVMDFVRSERPGDVAEAEDMIKNCRN
jgi:ankyrin repeat protein